MPPAAYTVRVVTLDGTVVATLGDAALGEIRRELNRPRTFTFDLHPYDPAVASVVSDAREIQVLRDGVVEFWGPVTRWDADADVVRVQCSDPLWYLHRRFFGRADRTNLLGNPDFEDAVSLAGWTASGPTATADTAQRINGAKAAKLVQATAGADSFIYQQITRTAGGVGDVLTLVAWLYIQDSGWLGGALGDLGLYVRREVAGVQQGEAAFVTVDGDTTRGGWVRLQTEIHQPPNVTEDIEVRLYAPGGTVWWDAVSLTLMESLSYYNADQATIAAGIVAHGQNTSFGKTSVNLATSAAASGVLRDRHYQFAEHGNILSALEEFPDLSDGLDFSVELTLTPAPAKTFTTHYPRKGTARGAGYTLTNAGATPNVLSFRVQKDKENGANSVTVLGSESGPDREEGGAVDGAAFGGVILETVEAARTGTPIDALDTAAIELLRVSKDPRTIEITVNPAQLPAVHDIVEGDTVPVDITWGGLPPITGTWRVITRGVDPTSDVPRFELNPA